MKNLTFTGVVYKMDDGACSVALIGAGGVYAPDLDSLTSTVDEVLDCLFNKEVSAFMSHPEPPPKDEVLNDPDYQDESTIGYVTSVVSTDGKEIKFHTEFHSFEKV